MEAPMSKANSYVRLLITFAAVAACAQANAQVLSWHLDQLYSNSDGNIEFVVVSEYQGVNGENQLTGSQFDSFYSAASHGHGPGQTQVFMFPNDLPSPQTAGRRFLVATQAFADLAIITPDYVLPNRFLASASGTLSIFKSSAQPFDTITYPGLPVDGQNALYRTGLPAPNVAMNFAGQTASVPATPDGLPTGQAVEYYYADWDYYFITSFPDEQAALDGGAFGGVWQRTGQTFNVWTQGSASSPGVCRFFSTSFAPKSSHFYTPVVSECDTVKTDPDWQFEAIAFFMQLTDVNGNCPDGTVPLYRFYNNGTGGAPNHRYTTSRAIFDQMTALGWTAEGNGDLTIFACVPP
jgi:hypothetical protein